MGRGGVREGERGELKGSRRERRKGSGWEGGRKKACEGVLMRYSCLASMVGVPCTMVDVAN